VINAYISLSLWAMRCLPLSLEPSRTTLICLPAAELERQKHLDQLRELEKQQEMARAMEEERQRQHEMKRQRELEVCHRYPSYLSSILRNFE